MTGPLRQRRDSRIRESQRQHDVIGPVSKSAYGLCGDPETSATLERGQLRGETGIVVGRIVQAVPYCHWYKVHLDGGRGIIGASAMASTGLLPIGVSVSGVYPPGSWVLIYVDSRRRDGIILGAIPQPLTDNSVAMSDWITQGSTGGLKREACHNFLMSLPKNGGINDYSNSRPIDSLSSGEYTFLAETGIGIHVDSFQTFLRVNEVCGVFGNYFDSHLRVAGWNMDLQTAVHEQIARLDEGELQLTEGIAVYPWEALGLPKAPGSWTKEHEDVAVQFEKPYGKIDVEKPELQAFYRRRNWGGYLGQGGKRMVVLPPDEEKYAYDENGKESIGVFDESIGLDGSYMLQTARSFVVAKRLSIAVPKQKRLPEDPRESSDSAENYMPSGKFGGGDEHKVGDPLKDIKQDGHGIRSAVAIQEFLAHSVQWKGVHPFALHKNDFHVPQPADQELQVRKTLDFDGQRVDPPTPIKKKVDHREEEVEYFETESYFALLPDGTVAHGDGFGAEIRMTNGSIMIDAPKGIFLRSGGSINLWAGDDLICRARKSVDVSATENDVRIKAEHNFHALAGNSGFGGILMESRSTDVFELDGKTGEDMVTSGVVLRAPNAKVTALASSIYLRTGDSPTIGEGPIVIDAAKGKADVRVVARTLERYIGSAITDNFGLDGKITRTNQYDSTSTVLGGSQLLVRGRAVVAGGGMVIDGDVVLPNGHVASGQGGEVGKLAGQSLAISRAVLSDTREAAQKLVTTAKENYQAIMPPLLYDENRIGNDQVVKQLEFGFRDVSEGKQYGTRDFLNGECRWQQMLRLGQAASQGTVWEEKRVLYHGEETYPFPGKEQFTVYDAMLELEEFKLAGEERDAARDAKVYGKPEPPKFKTKKLNETYLTIPSS